MCRSDVALYSAEWVKSSQETENKEIRSNGIGKCVSWVSLNAWALTRALDPKDTKYLAGPFEHAK
jgi:hypothetical protein